MPLSGEAEQEAVVNSDYLLFNNVDFLLVFNNVDY